MAGSLSRALHGFPPAREPARGGVGQAPKNKAVIAPPIDPKRSPWGAGASTRSEAGLTATT
jgi:hypothetical protein